MAFSEPGAVAATGTERAGGRIRAVVAGRRATVIGAGLGGLAVALRLAAAGWQVTVCERHGRIGGKMNLLEEDGFRFDTGPSLITMPWVFEELFEAVGERLADHVPMVRVSPLCRYIFDDGSRLEMTVRLPEWLPTIRRFEGGDASGFLRFLAMGAAALEVSQATFFGRSPFERPSIAELGVLRRPLPLDMMRPYARVVGGLCRDSKVRQVLNRYTTYVGSDPRRTPAMLSVIPAIETLYGGWHIRGGLYRLVEALGHLCERYGVVIRTHAHVERIATDGRRVRGVRLQGGETVPSDVVIMNGDAARLPELLNRSDGRGTRQEERSLSGLVLLFASRRRLEGWPHHQVLFSADYDDEFDDLFARRRFPKDPTVYINAPTRTDTSMAPPGCEVVFVMANAPANDAAVWDVSSLGEARDRMLARLERAGLMGDLADAKLVAELSPRWLEETFDMPGGAIYGVHSHGARNAFLRHPNKHRQVAGLYCVGGSSHPGGGTPTVLMSAKIVADLIQKYDRE
jgi:phytoene desaturase